MPKIVMITKIRKRSKRFPGKNVALLFGVPLYLWTVNFAKNFDYSYYLLHDYEDLYIPEWVNDIKVISEFCQDSHRLNHAIKWTNIEADIFILLQATSPLRSYQQIKFAIENFIKGDYDIGFNARRIQNGLFWNADGKEYNFSQKERTYNGCNKHIVFKETGSFYIFKRKMLDKKHILDTEKKIIFEDPYNIDIDTEDDLLEVECRLKRA